MRHFITILVTIALASSVASAAILTPHSLISEEYVFNSAANTINNVGMNTPVNQGDGVVSALGSTHIYHGGYAGSFATTAPGGGSSDLFASIGTDQAVELVFDLTGGGDAPADSVLFWQYENSGGGPDKVGNHTRTVEIRFNTEAEGSVLFAGPPVYVTLLPVSDGDTDSGNDLGGINSAQVFPLGNQSGRYVQISITDNYYQVQGMVGGGDRVGLGEIRFTSSGVQETVPQKAWLMAIHAHPDDEGIFFGGTLPYYSQALGLPVILVNMTTGWLNDDGTQTSDSFTRQAELWEAAIRYGLDVGPVFALFQQTNWNISIDNSWDRWADNITDGDDVADGQRRSSRRLAGLIRTYRPEVIATHDFGGEYGHPDHKALAFATAAAYDLAAGRDAVIDDGVTPPITITPEGVTGEPWDVKKLYIHSYGQGPLFHDHWETASIDSNGDGEEDQTPRQKANFALDAHVSQGRPNVVTVYDPQANGGNSWDNHPSEWWGLYASTVGPDSPADDFVIEGITYSGWARNDFTEHLAIPSAASCSVDVRSLDFGTVGVGEEAIREFVITNTGLGVLAGTVFLEGTDCEAFSILPDTETYELTWGQSHAVSVVFAPMVELYYYDCQINTGSASCGNILLSDIVSGIPDYAELSMLSAYPNPFNPQVEIRFELPREQQTEVAVYDLSGHLIAVLADQPYPAGAHTLSWSGRNALGASVPSGVYFILLKSKTVQQVKKVMLVR